MRLPVLLLVLLLSACGQSGALYLPDEGTVASPPVPPPPPSAPALPQNPAAQEEDEKTRKP